jgi:hypothetical protein
MRIYIFILAAAVLQTFILSHEVFAASQFVTANIRFDTALSIAKGNDINFGMVLAGKAGTYVIATSGDVTASDGGVLIGGSTQAGSLSIAGATTQSIDISVNNYVTSVGVTPSAATCAYNNAAPAPCALSSQAAPGTGKPLLVGVKLTVDGTQAIGSTAAPTFDVVVNYQ